MKPIHLLLFVSLGTFYASAQTPPQATPPIILLYGSKGSGRSTMTVKLQEDFHIPLVSLARLISSSDLDDTPLGKQVSFYLSKGEKLPCDVSTAILHDFLANTDCNNGVILEENPASIEELQALQQCMAQSFCLLPISIDASDEWIIQRFEHRLICRNCGRVYDMPFSPPRQSGVCDICNSSLQRRLDDSPEIIKSRLETYRAQTTTLFDYLRQQKMLTEIPGERDYDDIYKDVVQAIEGKTRLTHSCSSPQFASTPRE